MKIDDLPNTEHVDAVVGLPMIVGSAFCYQLDG
jgi:hypothetical protein